MRIIARRRLMQLATAYEDCVAQVAELSGMVGSMLVGDATEEYLALVRAFPLVHIRDDNHL
jgi:hypothetical protein